LFRQFSEYNIYSSYIVFSGVTYKNKLGKILDDKKLEPLFKECFELYKEYNKMKKNSFINIINDLKNDIENLNKLYSQKNISEARNFERVVCQKNAYYAGKLLNNDEFYRIKVKMYTKEIIHEFLRLFSENFDTQLKDKIKAFLLEKNN